MKILMLVNWKINRCLEKPRDKQPADYYVKNEQYWFFKYFINYPKVDIIDVSSFDWLENFEKKKLHFYIVQGLRAIPKLKEYDFIISHGMPSAVIVALWRRLFKTKAKHVVFDIGCFNSASTKGLVFSVMKYISKSIDVLIYHTSCQKEYYEKYFPWLTNKAKFVKFGTDYTYIKSIELKKIEDKDKYILCIDSGWRDRETLLGAYKKIDTDIKLKFVGKVLGDSKTVTGVEEVGRVSFDELQTYIDNALFCVLPLENKKFSYGQMTLLNQMALGKCVVAADVFSLMDYAEDKKNILFYKSGDKNDCKEKISMALCDHKLRDIIGKNAEKVSAEIYNEKTMALEIEKILNKYFDNVV